MGHYTGPKARINRRLGLDIYDSAGALRATHRRPQPPGKQPIRRRRPTDYAKALIEKQKIRHYYGLSQTQLERFFKIAKKQGGNKGQNLLLLCERRLDNVVSRARLSTTRAQATPSPRIHQAPGLRASSPSPVSTFLCAACAQNSHVPSREW